MKRDNHLRVVKEDPAQKAKEKEEVDLEEDLEEASEVAAVEEAAEAVEAASDQDQKE